MIYVHYWQKDDGTFSWDLHEIPGECVCQSVWMVPPTPGVWDV